MLNGLVVSDAQILGGTSRPGDVRTIRFSLGGLSPGSNDTSTNVAIDNIRITNGFLIPEPTPGLLAALGLVPVLCNRRRRE